MGGQSREDRALLEDEVRRRIGEALGHAWEARLESVVSGGPMEAFEQAAAALFGHNHGVATNNGTNALLAAGIALGLGQDSRLAVPLYGYYGMLAPFLFLGVEPVFLDVDWETLMPSARHLQEAESARPDALLVLYPWGTVGPADTYRAWAADLGIPVIADLSHAHGASLGGRPLGSYATVGAASYGPNKLMTGGELGVATTDDPELRTRLLAVGHYNRSRPTLMEETTRGHVGPTSHLAYGPKIRPNGMALAIANPQFEGLQDRLARRSARAREVEAVGAELAGLRPPRIPDGARRVHWKTPLRLATGDPAALRAHLATTGLTEDPTTYHALLCDHLVAAGRPVHHDHFGAEVLHQSRTELDRIFLFDVPDPGSVWLEAFRRALAAFSRGGPG